MLSRVLTVVRKLSISAMRLLPTVVSSSSSSCFRFSSVVVVSLVMFGPLVFFLLGV